MHFEDFLMTENSKEMVMSQQGMAALEPNHSFRIKMFQRTYVLYEKHIFFITDVVICPLGKHSLLNFCLHIPFIGELSIDNTVNISKQQDMKYVYNFIGIFTYCT